MASLGILVVLEVFPSEAGPGEANREEETTSGGACQEETFVWRITGRQGEEAAGAETSS